MKNNTTAFLIGTKFEAFANNTCLTCEQLFRSPNELSKFQRLVLGQGLGKPALSQIRSFLESAGLQDTIQIEEHLSEKIKPELVHKKFEKNVMITMPKKLDANLFQANLVVDQECAELSDHITGIHMQGALFVEAARQMFLGCLDDIANEAGFKREQYGYLLKDIQVSYKHFLYPLPINIFLRINELKELRRSRIFASEVLVQFEQGGEIGVEVACKARGHDKQALVLQETVGAARLFDKLLVAGTGASKLTNETELRI